MPEQNWEQNLDPKISPHSTEDTCYKHFHSNLFAYFRKHCIVLLISFGSLTPSLYSLMSFTLNICRRCSLNITRVKNRIISRDKIKAHWCLQRLKSCLPTCCRCENKAVPKDRREIVNDSSLFVDKVWCAEKGVLSRIRHDWRAKCICNS